MRRLCRLCLVIFAAGGIQNATAQSIPVPTELQDISTSAVVHDTLANDTTASLHRSPGISHLVEPGSPSTTHPQPVAFDPATMMHVDELQPGMKGYGLSVFSGLEPERFDVEIIGVRHRMMAGTDIIYCRINSPHLQELGVIAGMSGSPVYINDRLIGAVAYGFTNVDEPLAGVTPFETMLSVYNSTPTVPAQAPEASADAGGFASYQSYMALKAEPTLENLRRVALPLTSLQPLQAHAADFSSDIAARYNLPDEFTMVPLSAPVTLNSGNPMTAQLAESVFHGMNVMSGGQEMAAASTSWAPSALASNSPGGPLENLKAFSDKLSGGYSLAVPFIEGDLSMAMVGTVTWRQGDRLVAFGHPMFQNGTVYCPMAAARINALIRNRDKPFKMGEPIGDIGMIRQDRLPAVGGLFGQTAKMFPITTTITDPQYTGKRQFHFRVWNDKNMSPGLIMTALIESLGAAAREGGDSAALYNYSLRLSDGTSITAENYSSDPGGTMMVAMSAMADAGILMNNPFKPVDVEELSFEMQVTDKLRQASIESATLDKDDYHPGETATIEWLVRPYRNDPQRMTYSFQVPPGLPEGEYDIVVSDATNREALETRRNPGADKIRTYEDLVSKIQENFAENRVYISLVDKDTGISVRGSEMPRLPGSVINLIQDTVSDEYLAPVRGNFIVDADEKTPYEIHGQVTAKLNVKQSLAD